MSISYLLSTYVANPVSLIGLGLVWGTVALTHFKGPHTGDELRIVSGVILVLFGDVAWFVSNLLSQNWLGAGMDVFWFTVLIILWFRWKPRRKRKIKKLIGAKAKALRDKIVRKLKDARNRVPRPSLRPVPVPA